MIERDPQIVLAAEYFVTSEDSSALFSTLMQDPDFTKHVSGIWMPRNMLHEIGQSAIFENIARGINGYDYHLKEEPPVLIIDTHASGGVVDEIMDIVKILRNHKASSTVFTLSPTVSIKTVEQLQKMFEGQNVGFLLAGIYPEYDAEYIMTEYNVCEEEFIRRRSVKAEELGIEGLATLATHAGATLAWQYLLAMGITQSGRPYESSHGVIKRSTEPEPAMKGARNTDILVGRAMSRRMRAEHLVNPTNRVVKRVKQNILSLLDRAIAADRGLH